jgi:hypothetical protein
MYAKGVFLGQQLVLIESFEAGRTKASIKVHLRRPAQASQDKGERWDEHQYPEKVIEDRPSTGSEHSPTIARPRPAHARLARPLKQTWITR